MLIGEKEFQHNGLSYSIRSATERDADDLSVLRLQIDGETENLDREPGEEFLDPASFKRIILTDTLSPRNLFLVATVGERIVGFSRCAGVNLKRFSHKVQFGVCIQREYWGYGIGRNLLGESILWADQSGITKMTLNVLETNTVALNLYKRLGFDVEGILKNDKILSDGKYYSTIVMARFHNVAESNT